MSVNRTTIWYSAALLILTACATRTSVPEPVTEPIPVLLPASETPSPSNRTTWTLTPASEPARYISTVIATVESSSDSEVIRDTVAQQTRFTLLTATNSGSTAYLGSITEISNLPGNRIGAEDIRPVLPISFTGHISNGIMAIDELNGHVQSDQLDCTNPVYSALSIVQRRVVIVPPQITNTSAWTDSLTTKACNGRIPISITSVRSSRVIGEARINEIPAILIERNERTISTGEGSDGQHRVLLRGETTGLTRIHLDARTGALLSSEGEQRTSLLITAGRTKRFTQLVKEKTTAER